FKLTELIESDKESNIKRSSRFCSSELIFPKFEYANDNKTAVISIKTAYENRKSIEITPILSENNLNFINISN
ncbi:hypothetical protein, partial [uncultured Methanobrevibacter sp.]|uniref:hypothetical protein n=1 Tax=uncultured Methanobrevibacter sp. TaxID=253161 RepID=UPI0025847F20